MLKNKRISSIIIFVTLFVLHLFPVYAEESKDETKDFLITLRVTSGLMCGTVNEYVYENGSQISRLKWDMDFIVLAGFGIHFDLYNRISVSLGLQHSLNEGTGAITDEDFDSSTEVMTNYSNHYCNVNKALIADFSSGYKFYPFESFTVTPGISLRYKNLLFSAQDGYYQYPPESDPVNLYGTVIIYEQKQLIPSVSLGINYSFNTLLSIDIFLEMSPFAACNAKDSHVRRNIDFYDTFRNAFFYNSVLKIIYKTADIGSFFISAEYQTIRKIKGNTKNIDLDNGSMSQVIDDGAGFDYESLTFLIGIQKDFITW